MPRYFPSAEAARLMMPPRRCRRVRPFAYAAAVIFFFFRYAAAMLRGAQRGNIMAARNIARAGARQARHAHPRNARYAAKCAATRAARRLIICALHAQRVK